MTRPAYAPTKASGLALPMTRTNSAVVVTYAPISPKNLQPAATVAIPTTRAMDGAAGGRKASASRATTTPRRIAATVWLVSRRDRATVVEVAITAPSGA